MSKIHYATGGLITPEKSEFRTLCGRKFRTGGNNIMKSGWGWKEYCTCKDCKAILNWREYKTEFYQKLDKTIKKAFMDDGLTKRLMDHMDKISI